MDEIEIESLQTPFKIRRELGLCRCVSYRASATIFWRWVIFCNLEVIKSVFLTPLLLVIQPHFLMHILWYLGLRVLKMKIHISKKLVCEHQESTTLSGLLYQQKAFIALLYGPLKVPKICHRGKLSNRKHRVEGRQNWILRAWPLIQSSWICPMSSDVCCFHSPASIP